MHFVGVFWSAHYGVGIKSRGCGRVKNEEEISSHLLLLQKYILLIFVLHIIYICLHRFTI